MKTYLRSIALLVACAPAFTFLGAQDIPTAGPSSPGNPYSGMNQDGGTMQYSLGASETIISNYYGNDGVSHSTNVSGTASLVTASQSKPTSFIYSGGYLFSGSKGVPSSTYQNFGISQGLISKHFNLEVSDFVSYLPSSPTAGISGVAGLGDIGTTPVGFYTGDSILTYYATRIANVASAGLETKLTSDLSLMTSGQYQIQRFVDGYGLDNTQAGGSAGLQYRLNARDTIGANYSYSRFTYGSNAFYYTGSFAFNTQGANLTYSHAFSPRVTGSLSVGPQWSETTTALYKQPRQLNVAASTQLSYVGRKNSASLMYFRGTTAGSGVVPGITSDNLGITLQRNFSSKWSGAITGNYAHTSGIFTLNVRQPVTNAFYGGVQVSRQLGRSLSGYASYSAQVQSLSNTPLPVNAFSGVTHIIGFGITFHPEAIHFGRH